MEVETDGAGGGGAAEAADPFETIFAKRGEKQHKSGKKKVVSGEKRHVVVIVGTSVSD